MQKSVLRPRIALISSWGETCGIAHYSWFLRRALSPHAEIEAFALPRTVMLDSNPREGDERIREIADHLGEFDCTCIQFEPGLFANTPERMSQRVSALARAARGLCVAFHATDRPYPRVPSLESALSPAFALHPGRAWERLKQRHAIARSVASWSSLYAALDAKSPSIIAHIEIDAAYLARRMPHARVRHHPLCYMSDADIAELPKRAATSALADLMPPHEGKRFIGLFGFHAPYKGFDIAVRALRYLPREYEILMFSNVHPTRIYNGATEFPELVHLVSLVEDLRLADRVHFIGSVSDDDILFAMLLCDAVVLAYRSTMHSSSGPASQAIELARPILCSNSIQFLELAKYFPEHVTFFDATNHLELAQKIARLPKGRAHFAGKLRIVEFPPKPRAFSIETLACLYSEFFRSAARANS